MKKIKRRIQERKQKKEFLNNMPSAFDNASMSWVAPEFIPHKRGWIWRSVTVLLMLSLIVFGILTDSWTFSLAIGAFALAYYFMDTKETRVLEVSISDAGVKVGNRKYPFEKIKGFWIVYDPPYTSTLNLDVVGELNNHVVIQMDHEGPGKIRKLLSARIPELKDKEESFVSIFTRLFKL